MQGQHTITQLAQNYEISFAAVAKHLTVLEKAKLVIKRRNGKEQIVSISSEAFRDASQFLTRFESLWDYRFNAMDAILQEENNHE
ncbi:hypothetical protein D3C86_1877210 [compost metagenome]